MAQPYCTGPVNIYANLAATIPFDETTAGGSVAANTVLFLGWGEAAPVININSQHLPVMSDVAGGVPFDLMFQGEDADISVDLTVYNEIVFRKLVARPRYSGTAGTGATGDIGTLHRTEGTNFCLYLQFPYASTKTAFQSAADGDELPEGYRFPSCCIDGPVQIIGGTKVNKRRVRFRAIPVIASTGSYVLYDHNMFPILSAGSPITPPTAKTGVIS
jgi:hypothetical protein